MTLTESQLQQSPAAATAAPATAAWQRHYRLWLVASDMACVALASLLALFLRFGQTATSEVTAGGHLSFRLFAALLVPAWMASLVAVRAYEARYLGTGPEEFKRVSSASLRLMAAIAIISYAAQLQLARGFVAIALPVGVAALLINRYLARRYLHRRRAEGRCQHRVVAVGGADPVKGLISELHRAPYAGFQVVAACVPGVDRNSDVADVPVLGGLGSVLEVVRSVGADTVAVASGPGLAPNVLRKLSWELEGTGVDLVVAPALTDIAGPRINIRPVAGLPLLHVDEPELTGFRYAFKRCIEWAAALVVSILVLPILLVAALAVRLDSPGAPVFRQTRVGRHGREFTVYKLRTMRVDAETLLANLREQNESDGPLFKLREDPRVTRVGRLLRSWSLDELPQLWNVIKGDMALIGPRPPLPGEVAVYGSDVARRLLVKPGVTGLWQVSGRADLSWEDSVRLDLYYVENWSLAMDAMILWKTLFAVAQRHGAY